MTTFQLLLLIISASVFYMFFKQIFSGDHPKRGVDFEANTPDAQIGGVSRPDKIFSRTASHPDRLNELLDTADEAVEKGDFQEASKALQSAIIIDDKNIDALHKSAYVFTQMKEYDRAKENCLQIINIDKNDDMAQALLANTLHKLGENDLSEIHHKKSIELDPEYAPHHYNYANTLYDLDRKEEALAEYKKAYELDSSLDAANDMIKKLSE